MGNDDIWRQYVNSLPTVEEGSDPPNMEAIQTKKPVGRKFFVQKIVTEIYVYTDAENHLFSEATFQDLFLLGEMSESKLNRLLKNASKKRNRD